MIGVKGNSIVGMIANKTNKEECNMNLVLPNNYVELDQEEMTYLDGGNSRTYSGAQGWAVAATLSSVGATMALFGKAIKTAVLPYLTSVLAGGPIAWLAAALGGIGVGLIYYMGTCFMGAGTAASWNMLTKGSFTIKSKWDVYSPISIT